MNNPIHFSDREGNLLIDPNGNIIYSKNGEPRTEPANSKEFTTTKTAKDGMKITTLTEIVPVMQDVFIYTNDGTPVNASILVGYQVTQTTSLQDKSGNAIGTPMVKSVNYDDLDQNTKMTNEKSSSGYDCHGLTFTNGKMWIDNDQAQIIIEHDKDKVDGAIYDKAFVAYYESYELNTPTGAVKTEGRLIHTTPLNKDGTVNSKRGAERQVNNSTVQKEKAYYSEPRYLDDGSKTAIKIAPKISTKTIPHYNKVAKSAPTTPVKK